MADFDPYRKWFDIEPGVHPIDHYQLLGLPQFESSSDAIENAVAARAEFLQALSMGQHVQHAQRILSEVARARICLLDRKRKAAYDEKLRHHDLPADAPMPMAIPLENPEDDTNALRELQMALAGRESNKSSTRNVNQVAQIPSKNKKQLRIAVIGLMLIGAVAIAATIFIALPEKNRADKSAVAEGESTWTDLPEVDRTNASLPSAHVENSKPKTKTPPPNRKTDSKSKGSATGKTAGKAKKPSPKPPTTKPKSVGKPKPAITPSVAAKAPAIVLPKFPLNFFPDYVQLPGRNDLSKIELGELIVSAEAELRLKLHYPEAWSGGTVKYQVRLDNNAKRRWIVSQMEIKSPSEYVEVAQISLDGYSLNFQWMSVAKQLADAEYLRNGVLEIFHGDDQSKRVSLQTLRPLGRLNISAKDFSGRVREKLERLPNFKTLKFRLAPLSKWQVGTLTYCDPAIGASKDPLRMYFSKEPSERFLWLEVTPSLRDNTAAIDAELKIKIGDKIKTVNSKQDLQEVVQFLNAGAADLQKQSEAKQIPKKRKDQLLANKRRVAHQVTVCERYKNQVIPKLPDCNLNLSMFYQSGGHQVIAASTGGRKFSTQAFVDRIEEFKDYKLVYDIDLTSLAANIKYDADFSGTIGKFDRIGYLLELKKPRLQTLFVSMDAFTDDISLIGIPTSDKSVFQQAVKHMNVYCNDKKQVASGLNLKSGYLEFWPHTYSPENAKKVEGASGTLHDFGDKRSPRGKYGSMQIHDLEAKKTIFALNHWDQGETADLGIGNWTGKNPDWTFAANAKSYSMRRLRIYVRPTSELAD